MKRTTKAVLFGALIASTVFLILSHLGPANAQAATPTGEQYKVVAIPNYRDEQQLAQELNRLGSEGWKVRGGAMWALVLAK